VFTGGALSVRHCGNGDTTLIDPNRLYDSVVDVLFQLPEETLVYPAHHHGGVTVTTIGAERRYNPDLALGNREAFVERYARLLGDGCTPRQRWSEPSSTSNQQTNH
jgi:glyoxylase-like metal-dependent hydrolase (beta-lactamase superfamily II)